MASLEAFSLGLQYDLEAKDDGEMLGGASTSFGLARDEVVNSMANRLRNFLSRVSLILLFSYSSSFKLSLVLTL